VTGSKKKGKEKPSAKRGGYVASVPTREQVLEFIKDNPDKTSKRDIGRAFGVTGANRIPLKHMLRDLAEEGLIEKRVGKTYLAKGDLPAVTVLEITDVDTDGEYKARATAHDPDLEPPRIYLAPGAGMGRSNSGRALGIGDRVLARLKKQDDGAYEAKVMRRIDQEEGRILGVYQKVGRDGRIMPVQRRERNEYSVRGDDANSAQPGELVFGELVSGRAHGARTARVTERLGSTDDPSTISLIAVHTHGIPMDFPSAVLNEAESAKAPKPDTRTDLTHLPFVTIDPADARDHDDAVFAEADTDPSNVGGWIVWVAIADVAHFVTPGSALDKEALRRGNSCYFPDRVVPMLPDHLSGDLCSLHEDVDRTCLAVRMTFDQDGHKKAHKFVRGILRSRGSLTYTQVQSGIDGHPDTQTAPMMDTVVSPLWKAYRAVEKARNERQPLELNVPEHKIELGEDGTITKVAIRERIDAHRVIEDFMIAANVCAAETLEKQNTPLLYRIHEPPNDEKLSSLQEFLSTLDIKIDKGQAVHTMHLNKILEKVVGGDYEAMVNQVMLRSQSQAMYSPQNAGHFGLNLARYAHFTSPIRRYADLIVHRALIRACKLGDGGLEDFEVDRLTEVAEEISGHERRALAAERESNDRYVASFLQDRVGATFHGRVTGVTRFGLFICLDDTGADGLVPIRRLGGNEYYHHSESEHALIGERSGSRYRLGDVVEVKLEEATPLTGGLLFDILTPPKPGEKIKRQPRPQRSQSHSHSHSHRGKPGKSSQRKRARKK
jgi:ribonuclease R